ncbi:MAG: SUMF1/EgtB/PvdO family nonheme iron enzyme, partial [Bacteroidota bacterium]
DGHTAAPGSTIQTSSDGVGAFVYRAADGSGDVDYQSMALRWNYGANLVDDNDIVDVQVYAIEMVYVPQGAYELGSTGLGVTSTDETDFFYRNTGIFGLLDTYNVTSEAAIPIANNSSSLFYDNSASENQGDQLGPIPAAYPKGFGAFWSMKYEITEDQFISFFNTLTDTQKDNNDPTGPDGKNSDGVVLRNTLAWITGYMTTDAPERAVSFLDYESCAAYMDWSGLRFMTELEYEKSAKGPTHTVDQLASGGTSAFAAGPYTIDNDGEADAIITNHGENITNVTFFITDQGGPDRVGIHAASSINNTREETGGSYYGIMELSGNLYERVIGVGSPVNRAYEGTHGDGELTNSGVHNVVSWPANGSEGAHAYRGGSWANEIGLCRVADRTSACILNAITNSRIGIRGGRTAE